MTNKEVLEFAKKECEAYKRKVNGGFGYYQRVVDYYDIVIEALEVAERLKQAMADEQTADCIIVDAECINNKHDKEVWLSGYNQALADIRGE